MPVNMPGSATGNRARGGTDDDTACSTASRVGGANSRKRHAPGCLPGERAASNGHSRHVVDEQSFCEDTFEPDFGRSFDSPKFGRGGGAGGRGQGYQATNGYVSGAQGGARNGFQQFRGSGKRKNKQRAMRSRGRNGRGHAH